MSQDKDPLPRLPPRLVPTLTDMVGAAESAPSPQMAPPPVPAAFVDLLKGWPVLGESKADGPAPADQPEESDERDTHAERVALRAEALVMQRLPALMAGLISSAVRDAMAEITPNDEKKG